MARRIPLEVQDHGFVGYPFDYRVTVGFGSIAGGIDHVNLIIRLPLQHRISMVLGLDDYSNPSVDENVEPVIDDFEELKKCMEIVPDDEDESTIYYLLVEKFYPLTKNTLHQLWSDVRLHVDHDVEMAYDLLRFIIKQLMEG
nr:hypothetical protein [Tanacetum cinerariifolium]